MTDYELLRWVVWDCARRPKAEHTGQPGYVYIYTRRPHIVGDASMPIGKFFTDRCFTARTLDEMRRLIEPEYKELLEAVIAELDMLEFL